MEEYTTEVEGRRRKPEEPAPERAGGTEEPPEPRRRTRAIVFLLLAGVAAVAAGAWVWLHYRDRVSTDDAQVDGHIAAISTRVSGSVQAVPVEHNQPVKAGDVLVRIDPRDYQARVDQAKAALALAVSQVRAAQAGVPLTAETTQSGTQGAEATVMQAEAEHRRAQIGADQAGTSDIAAARATLEAAQASNERAQADLARMKPLVAKAEISQQQYDAYLAAARVAEAQVRNAREKLSAAEQSAANANAATAVAEARVRAARAGLAGARAGQRQVQVSAAQLVSAQAAVEQARANLATAELQLGYCTVVAPVDGVVTRKTVEVGQTVQPGQGLMTIIPLHDVWVTANFKETQLATVRTGQRVEVKVDMYERTVAGRVDSIAGATGARLSLLPPENATGNFVKVVQRIPVRVVFDALPPGVVLRPGMNVDVTIFTK